MNDTKKMAEYLARELFKLGASSSGRPVSRIEFKVVGASGLEQPTGGLGEVSMARFLALLLDKFDAENTQPIDMVLHCPKCGTQHIDAPEERDALKGFKVTPEPWTNPPHRSHLCHGCGHIWRPADVPTNGVAALKTTGKNDSPPGSWARKPPLLLAHDPKAFLRCSKCSQPLTLWAEPLTEERILSNAGVQVARRLIRDTEAEGVIEIARAIERAHGIK